LHGSSFSCFPALNPRLKSRHFEPGAEKASGTAEEEKPTTIAALDRVFGEEDSGEGQIAAPPALG
jgi:hypothetical protein